MKKTFALAMAAASLSFSAALAQTSQTNVVQQLDLHLLGIQQGGTSTNRDVVTTKVTFVKVDNQDIIAALGATTGNTFSNSSKLVIITPITGGSSSIAVRTGSNSVDVTRFFILEQIGDSVTSSQYNTTTGRSSSTDYSIQRLVLQDTTNETLSLHFDVRGLVVGTSSAGCQPGGLGGRDGDERERSLGGGRKCAIVEERAGLGFGRSNEGVTGTGDDGGTYMILEGSLSIQGRTIEVVTGGGGGGGGGGT